MFRSASLVLSTLLLVACSTGPSLVETPATGFNLSGDWRLVPELSDVAPDPRRIIDQVDREIVERGANRNTRKRVLGGTVFAFVTHDFAVLNARRMQIEQNADSMGIDYDPGEYRDITFGERERGLWKVSAGWDETGALVIYSVSDDLRATETHTLAGDQLTVRVHVRGRGSEIEVARVFRRSN